MDHGDGKNEVHGAVEVVDTERIGPGQRVSMRWMRPALVARRRRALSILGWISTAITRPEPTRRASANVKKPMPGPGSRMVMPGVTYGAISSSGFCIQRRMGLTRK